MIRWTLSLCAGITVGYLLALVTLLGPRETLECLELTVRGYNASDVAPRVRAEVVEAPPLQPSYEPTPEIEPWIPERSFHAYDRAVEDDGRPEDDSEDSVRRVTLMGFLYPDHCPLEPNEQHTLTFWGCRGTGDDGFLVGYGFMTCEDCGTSWAITWSSGLDPILHKLAKD